MTLKGYYASCWQVNSNGICNKKRSPIKKTEEEAVAWIEHFLGLDRSPPTPEKQLATIRKILQRSSIAEEKLAAIRKIIK